MKNLFILTETTFKNDEFLKGTNNRFRVVSQMPYLDKNQKTGIVGTTLTLSILEDHIDYGVDKNGVKRENNQYENFNVTILNGKTELADLKKGDIIALKDYDSKNSMIIGFDALLRYNGYQKLEK